MRSKLVGGLLVLIVLIVAVFVVLVLVARPPAEHPFFAQFDQYPLVMAHQGGNGLWPDNTLYAFERAVALVVCQSSIDG